MRHSVTLCAAALMLSGCANLAGTPAVVEPVEIRSGVSEQNRFVPPPGGFEAAAAAAVASTAAPGIPAGTATPGFVPLDDNGFSASTSAAQARGATGPNIVDYALNTTHPVGTPRYRRGNPLRWQTWERNCLRYPSQDSAQEAFLAAGGPDRDRHNLDPDGDGYACWWDPGPFRRAMRAGG